MVLGVVSSDELAADGSQGATEGDGGAVVYIVASGYPTAGGPYGPRDAWGAVRRKRF